MVYINEQVHNILYGIQLNDSLQMRTYSKSFLRNLWGSTKIWFTRKQGTD